MQPEPLNRRRAPEPWASFDPGVYLDTNPSFVRLGPDDARAVFCRYPVPPSPGEGSIWAVRVDADLQPAGRPVPLLGQGLDPRVVRLGDDVLVFYGIIERDAAGAVAGSAVALAEYRVAGDAWISRRNFLFPKHPLGGAPLGDAQPGWEKNWVPFPIGARRVGLLYSHEPWNVITLDLPPDAPPRFEAVHPGPALVWDYGTIRGGTPPVPHGDDQLLSFFHASQVIGSRTVYSVGACAFQATPPYAPVAFTAEPLLLAPYNGGVHRFGWPFAISVLFPGGVEHIGGDYRLLAGRDDGEIVTFAIDHRELAARLGPVRSGPAGAIHDYRGGPGARLPLAPLLYVPDPIPGIPELPMVRFLRTLAGRGRTFVDVGAHIGFYTMGLAPGFARVVAFEPSRLQHGWLVRNRALNDYRHVACEAVALGAAPGEARLNVLSYEGGLNSLSPEVAAQYQVIEHYTVPVETLDQRGLDDVDLLKIDVEGFEIQVLQGAVRTIRASRPVILIEIWDNPSRRAEVAAVLDVLDYGCEFLFPRAPELALCLPRERRADYAWFV